ncbi:MAG: PQQ-dependent sugar dehydrogenase, partial [Planctomycetia bacterium]
MQTFSGKVMAGLAAFLLLTVTSSLHASDTKRIPWTESKLTGTPEPPLPWRVAGCYEKLALKAPVYLRAEPGTRRLLYVDHKAEGAEPGGLRAFVDDANCSESEPILTMDNLIYGFCFHPRYQENGYLFVISNGPHKESSKKNRISRFTISRDSSGRVLRDSELVILEWESNGHNGGDLGFGPDGFLYCPTGDGTTDSDPLQTGQGLNDLLAVMLRLDVDRPGADKPYSIPADNPFLKTPGARPEIWAYGFRNPWRMDFDRKTGQLWLGQNGQDLWEQVYLVRRGENYGWSIQEGSHPFYAER